MVRWLWLLLNFAFLSSKKAETKQLKVSSAACPYSTNMMNRPSVVQSCAQVDLCNCMESNLGSAIII